MSTIVFLGPSLEVQEARAILEADYRPPVQQGDVLRALADRPKAIGIIDGYFDTTPSVWHKEILEAISRGVRVIGGGSMGALRAAELHPYGMQGVGQIFGWYRDGALEDDDEVAVLHEPAEAGYRELSVALVNIRDVVAAAERAGKLRSATATKLVQISKELFYADRTYANVLGRAREARLDPDELEQFDAFRRSSGEPLKRRDAVAVLRALRDAATLGDDPPVVRVENTIFLESLRNEVRTSLATGASTLVDPQAVVRGGHSLAVVRRNVLLSVLASAEIDRLGISVSAEEVQEAANEFRRDSGLLRRDDMNRWLEQGQLSLDDFTQLMRDQVSLRKLERRYAHEIERRVPHHIQMNAIRKKGERA